MRNSDGTVLDPVADGALLWRDAASPDGLLGGATSAYGDAYGAERERLFTRAPAPGC